MALDGLFVFKFFHLFSSSGTLTVVCTNPEFLLHSYNRALWCGGWCRCSEEDTVIIAIDIMQKTCNKCKQIINRDSSPQKFEFIGHKLFLSIHSLWILEV